jgi:hypothetical protein
MNQELIKIQNQLIQEIDKHKQMLFTIFLKDEVSAVSRLQSFERIFVYSTEFQENFESMNKRILDILSQDHNLTTEQIDDLIEIILEPGINCFDLIGEIYYNVHQNLTPEEIVENISHLLV